KHYSLQTEKSYLAWIRRFIRFHDLKHPKDLFNAEIEQFLSHLSLNRQVSAATQNQALCALIFMYKHVIKREIVGLSYSLTKKPKRMPTVLDANEAGIIISLMKRKYKLITALLYGAGLRINEALRLRIKDIDFSNKTIFVFRGKGEKIDIPYSLKNS
ncbi:phage integrase N-terminal SAM-like domain-containing protein, partial [Alteromonas sp. a30]|uniref:phage integrase N-terminal SAM-like domain-containing protein n=1 Tax=Alteromonas sp. a30 TaxID=2730917 RepID=UPI00227E55D3